MSEEIAQANANLAEIARLHGELGQIGDLISQLQREIAAKRRARQIAEADNVTLLLIARRFVTAATWPQLIKDSMALSAPHPGTALLAEPDAARAIVATFRQHWNAGGEVWHSIDRDFADYDAAVKASNT